ncbi:TPA: ABC transporter ATP-binding protein [Serratia liquefaciens]
MSCNDVAIRVSNLGKAYRIYKKTNHAIYQAFFGKRKRLYTEFWAINNVSFEINKGETVAILGRNGAGKSTLLQLICSTLTPTVGEIYKSGKIAALLELGAGFNGEFTGRENIYISGAIYGLSKAEIDKKFEAIERFADIGTFIDQPVKNYSSGMFVRLAFALIVNVDAEILIIDEALAVGDVFFQQKCMRFLRDFQQKGGTILFVSHDTSAVMALCQKAVLIRRGEDGNSVILQGDSDVICQDYLRDLYADPERLTNNTLAHGHVNSGYEAKKTIEGDMLLPNQYYVSDMNKNAAFFGQGGGSIELVTILDSDGNRISHLSSGQDVTISVIVRAEIFIKNPAIGIILKDSKGQFIFTESTDAHFREENISIPAGHQVEVQFTFKMPVLIRGTYSLDVAFANGLGDDHYQLQWKHDILAIECLSGRQVHGILGFNDLNINWNTN